MQILDYRWHQVHAWRLHAIPGAYFTFVHVEPQDWHPQVRPEPLNWRGAVWPQDVNPADYDFALLHLDQWCDQMNLRALPYRIMKVISRDLPRAVIMHGTPDHEENRQNILALLGDLPVVCNSEQAAQEWDGGEGRLDCYGRPQFNAIIHGYKVDEFYNYGLARRRREIFTVCSGRDMSRWYHGLPLVERLQRDLPLAWYGPAGNREWLPNYHLYRDMLASSLIYFSPTRRAPMPGARTEAMLSGCCVVTTPGNDITQYIIDGQNGFIVDTYERARGILRDLLANPEAAYEIGQAGRETARKHFEHTRYTEEWLTLIKEITEANNV
jgi:glycosyltransferase involved in cell wall biosynthesis